MSQAVKDILDQERAEAAVIFGELYQMYRRNKWKARVFILFEVWTHSLAIHHAAEWKSIYDAFSPIGIIIPLPW